METNKENQSLTLLQRIPWNSALNRMFPSNPYPQSSVNPKEEGERLESGGWRAPGEQGPLNQLIKIHMNL